MHAHLETVYKFSKNVETYLKKRIGKCLNGAM